MIDHVCNFVSSLFELVYKLFRPDSWIERYAGKNGTLDASILILVNNWKTTLTFQMVEACKTENCPTTYLILRYIESLSVTREYVLSLCGSCECLQ